MRRSVFISLVIVFLAVFGPSVFAQELPKILLEKTVGLTPETANQGVITVTAGTTVYYKYVLMYPGPSPQGGVSLSGMPITCNFPCALTSHVLTDDKLGVLLSGDTRTLFPGDSFTITAPYPITQTTTNTAMWEASFGPDMAAGSLQPAGGFTMTAAVTATAQATVNVIQEALEPVPTLGEWAILLLATLLLLAGVLFLRPSSEGGLS